jgi:RNA recognition motif-containing protein
MGNRLYVGNLSFDATAESLRSCFTECGTVSDLAIITDRETGRSRGFGFVTMSSDTEARDAIERLNGAMVEGRPLRVNEAQERTRSAGENRNARGGHRGW